MEAQIGHTRFMGPYRVGGSGNMMYATRDGHFSLCRLGAWVLTVNAPGKRVLYFDAYDDMLVCVERLEKIRAHEHTTNEKV
jgi:hypothetical protein